MDERYTVNENQLLYALTIALMAHKHGDAMTDHAVKNCLETIEQHCLHGRASAAFDMSFCQFTGYLYQKVDGKRFTVGTLRISALGHARVSKVQPLTHFHGITTVDRTEQYTERKEQRRGVFRIDIKGSLPC